MTSVVRVWSAVAVLIALAAVPAGMAQSEQLEAAIELFEQQAYVEAQEALLDVDPDELSETERTQLEQLLERVREAIQASEKAHQDLVAADDAYDDGNWELAERLYQAVQDNPYAAAPARDHAAAQQERIAAKRRLAEAAKPSGTVEEKLTVEERVEEPHATEEVVVVVAEETDEPAVKRLTPTDELRLRDELLWQRAVAQAQQAQAKAREAITEHDYAAARRLADNALQTIEAARNYAEPVSRFESARQEAMRLKDEVEQAADRYAQRMAEEERQQIRERIETRRRVLEEQRQEKIQQLFNSAEQLRREQRFAEAAEVLRQILRLDPDNAKARYQLEVAEDYESFAEQRQWYEDLHFQQRRSLLKAEESMIPWDYDVLYPKNWRELCARRKSIGLATGRNFQEAELNRRLDEPLAEVRFEEQPFGQVVDFLSDITDTNIAVDWNDLSNYAITPDRPVSLRLGNVAFRTVLSEVLTQVGGETELGFAVGDGLLRVATQHKLDRNKHTLIYDIRDLLVNIPQVAQPDYVTNPSRGGRSSQRVARANVGGSLFDRGMNQSSATGEQLDPSAETMLKIKQIIRQTVEPDSWLEAGAGPGGGSIQDLNGNLLIYATSEAHRQVIDVLGQLRETQALQLSVESRFLDVVANFLEQFGVDLDFVFNSGTAGYDRATDLIDPFTGAPVLIPRQYTQMGRFANNPQFGQALGAGPTPQQPYGHAAFVPPYGGMGPTASRMTPIAAQQGSLTLVDPTAINTAVPGSLGQSSTFQPALNISGSFLDNIQVDFLIRATQANRRSSIVQAPRAVMLNGQAVEIRIETARRYVSSLEPVVGENVALPRPVPDDALSGLSMWVFGVISADRCYSTLSIALLNQGEPTFDRYELQRASGNSPSIFLLLPTYSRTTLTTTVNIPDGGTVLLGGFKQVGEVEIDAGVPILSKIPVLNRAFKNQTVVKDTRTLLILVKSKIIIQKEAEEEAFPTFSRMSPS